MNGVDTNGIVTYILRTKKGEFYCGKTNNLKRRLEEHKQRKNGSWFSYNERNDFKLIISIQGNFEKNVKRFGVKNYLNAMGCLPRE